MAKRASATRSAKRSAKRASTPRSSASSTGSTAPNQTVQPDLRRARDLVMQLMAIPGKSGQEQAVADVVVDVARQAGLPEKAIKYDTAQRRSREPGGQIGNLIIKLPGTLRQPRRLLSAHLDTVPICVGCKPKRNGSMVRSADPKTGLGADNRAGCATVLTALREILEHDLPHPPLTFCFFVQEEIGLQGSRCVTQSMLGKPGMGFNWDGGGPFKLTIGATGGYRLRIGIDGVASHAGGAPEWGVSAIAIASLAIADLHENGWHGLIEKGKQRGTSNVGVIEGGAATNVVTDRVDIRAEARSHDPKFRRRIVKAIETAFQKAARKVKSVAGAHGNVSFEGRLDYESFKLKKSDPCVRVAASAVEHAGGEPVFAIANGGVDANWLSAHGIPTVSLGCGQMGQHTVQEQLDLEQFDEACRVALWIASGGGHATG